MLRGSRSLLFGIASLCMGCAVLLGGCGSSSYSSTLGSSPPPDTGSTGGGSTAPSGFGGSATLTGANDAVVATPSSDNVVVVVGASRTVSIAFTSTDGRVATGFGISGSLGTLPPGWRGPDSFGCASVSTGSNCVLNLTYTPTAVGGGTLVIAYVFVNNATQPQTQSTVSITYSATASDNVVATASPTGQIDAVVGGGAQPVSVNFITDDGNAATNFSLTTDLSNLPPGWSASATGLACAIVSTGSGCELVLSYAPASAGSGTLKLAYGYTDDAGTSKTGTLNIPYAAAPPNAVIATASPTSQVIAVQKTGGQPVVVTFTTNDGKAASNLFMVSNLKDLPTGWSSGSGEFSCGSVSTGNGCQLHLTYAPAALGSGTLSLNYAYKNSGGAAQTGTINLDYAATTNDNVVGTPSPSGQINAVVADGSQPGTGVQAVAVTFTTDDGRPATALQLTTDLTLLPAGWSSTDTSFSCSGLNADTVCSLPLAYAPTAAGSGTLMLGYTYKNNANESKTGSVSIAYRATTNDNVVGTPSPSTIPPLRTGSSATASVTFTTDDGNPATGLVITGGLAALPPGWSAASNAFTCATVSTGSSCALSLTYAPLVAVGPSALTLNFSYLNNAGYTNTGSVTISYSAFTPYLYVADAGSATLSSCALNLDDSVQACVAAGSGFVGATGLAVSGNSAYVANGGGSPGSVSRCTLDIAGGLADCAPTGGTFTAPVAIATNPGTAFAYVQQTGGLTVCTIAAGDGSLSGCVPAAAAFEPLAGIAFSADGTHAFSAHAVIDLVTPANSTNVIDVCNVSAADGTLSGCVPSIASTPLAAAALAIQNNFLYLSNSGGAMYRCPITTFSTISSCLVTGPAGTVAGIAFKDTTAFVSDGSTTVWSCPVAANGTLGACSSVSDVTFNGTQGLAIR